MWSIIGKILGGLGKFLGALLPPLIRESKKRRDVKMMGNDPKLRDEMDKSIESEIKKNADDTGNNS